MNLNLLSNFSYGDKRIDRVSSVFFNCLKENYCYCVRRIAGTRSREVAFHRLLNNDKFSVIKMVEEAAFHAKKVTRSIKHVLCIHDTTELYFESKGRKHQRSGLGPLSSSLCRGFFVHPGLLVDAEDSSVLGISDVIVWSREEADEIKVPGKKDRSYLKLPIEEKESYRWIKLCETTKERFRDANKITFVSDRESDIYDYLERVPSSNCDIVVRSSSNRTLMNGEGLFETLDSTPQSFCYKILLKEITGQRKKRVANLEVSYIRVEIKKPKTGKNKEEKISLNSILVKEVTPDISEEDRIIWRILTTHEINDVENAFLVVEWYRKRWIIEELFRTIKKQGIDIEDSQLRTGNSLEKLAVAGLLTAVRTQQLVRSRDGNNNREYKDVFEEKDLPLMEKLNKKLEGKTIKQKNPHTVRSLAWAAWIISRLGGWKGYNCERPPGSITIGRGLQAFYKIREGYFLVETY